jgi:hypothetical protein
MNSSVIVFRQISRLYYRLTDRGISFRETWQRWESDFDELRKEGRKQGTDFFPDFMLSLFTIKRGGNVFYLQCARK